MFLGSVESFGVVELDPRTAAGRSDLQIVDVREPAELAGGYIRGARNVPLGDVLSRGLPGEIDLTRPVLFVCRSGGRSLRAAQMMAAQGASEPLNLAGGMIAWAQSGLPMAG